ncbi:class I SAM-dependent methyltransferase [Actinomycetospora chlora]|uniref:Class I SAM-dependent methyltransferase n=1 Tax=Actinomycetospora chlora TaxID=663608 RepID=A0ABP9A6S6_9PSEU
MRSREPDGLTPVQESLFLTLHLRALDARSADPILGDTASADLADALDHDFSPQRTQRSVVLDLATRTKVLDDLVRRFTARRPDAVVVDLGCGLDTRVLRCAPPPGVDWYDVDFPVVTALRDRYLPGVSHAVGADLTDRGWFEVLPADRPTMLVADGLVAFLRDDDLHGLLRGLTGHLAGGEFATNAYSPFAMWASRYTAAFRAIGLTAASTGFLDPHEPERWDAGLTLVEELLLARSPEIARYPPLLRAFTLLCARSTRVSREGNRVLRYRF